MSTAADRKKAREVYLATLKQQREEVTVAANAAAPMAPTAAYANREEKMNAREKMLEEKRLKFLQKSGKLPPSDTDTGAHNTGISPPASSVASVPTRFQPALQQQRDGETATLQTEQQHTAGPSAPANSLQAGKHGDDGMNTLATRYGKKDDPVYRPKPKNTVSAPPPHSSDPFRNGHQSDSPKKQGDPFAQNLGPQQLTGVRDGGGSGGGGDDDSGGLRNIGEDIPTNAKELKRHKQEEYARLLQQDSSTESQQQPHRGVASGGGGGLSAIGNAPDDKQSKRNKQAEYARQLQQDTNSGGSAVLPYSRPQQHRQDHDGSSAGLDSIGSIGHPSGPVDKESKRAKQAEYARQLQQDDRGWGQQQQQQQQQQQPYYQQQQQSQQQELQYQQRNYGGGGGGGGGGMFGGDHSDEKALKKQKQLEYNRQLQQDSSSAHQNAQPHSRPHDNGQHYDYSNPQHQNYPDVGGYNLVAGTGAGGGHGDAATDAKAIKRAKQAEYNRQLQEHEHLKRQQEAIQNQQQHNQLKHYHGQSPVKQRQNNNQSEQGSMSNQQNNNNSSLPDAGWEIGPLGQPVRKTLSVGNRGAQKAYSTQKHSPRKPTGAPSHHQNYNFNDDSSSFPQQNGIHFGNDSGEKGQGHNNVADNGSFGGIGQNDFSRHGGEGSAQSEYARAIEEQIRIKKEGNEAAKKAEQEEEARLYMRLERDREQMERAYEEEQKAKKAKEESDRVAALELQIEQKKQQKIDEENKQKELDRKEDERLARDQAALSAQLMEERRRDKKLDTAAAQQQQQPQHVGGNSFDEQPVGGGGKGGGDGGVFRAPSPIHDPTPRNKNLFRRESPVSTSGNKEENASQHFRTSTSPPSSPSNRRVVFQATSPVLESQPPATRLHQKESLFDPPSPHSHSHNRSPDREQQNMALDANHPIIRDLKQATASAKDEAAKARTELEQLRKLVSQDRKRSTHLSQSPKKSRAKQQIISPTADIPQLSLSQESRQENPSLGRVDSARTFIRKYQQKYNADKPPPDRNRFGNRDLEVEQSLKSESVLNLIPHASEAISGTELPSDFHALLELDKTLKSESRFVYPDGRSFVPGAQACSSNSQGQGGFARPGSANPRPQLSYQLQPYENAPKVPIKVPLPLPVPPLSPSFQHMDDLAILNEALTIDVPSSGRVSMSTLGSGPASPAESAVTLASERSRRKNNRPAGSPKQGRRNENSGGNDDADDDGLEFDVDRAFRRNRRKWELLEKAGLSQVRERIDMNGDKAHKDKDRDRDRDSGVFAGPEELDLLMNGLHSVSSSRPTTADTGNPPSSAGTLPGESQLMRRAAYGSLLEQERERYKVKQSRQQLRDVEPQPHRQTLSRPTSSASSSSSRPSSSHRAQSRRSNSRTSSATLLNSGRRAMEHTTHHFDDHGHHDRLASTTEKAKFNDLIARRNSTIQDHLSTASAETGRDRDTSRHQQQQVYDSISAEQVQDIDYSDYGF